MDVPCKGVGPTATAMTRDHPVNDLANLRLTRNRLMDTCRPTSFVRGLHKYTPYIVQQSPPLLVRIYKLGFAKQFGAAPATEETLRFTTIGSLCFWRHVSNRKPRTSALADTPGWYTLKTNWLKQPING